MPCQLLIDLVKHGFGQDVSSDEVGAVLLVHATICPDCVMTRRAIEQRELLNDPNRGAREEVYRQYRLADAKLRAVGVRIWPDPTPEQISSFSDHDR